MYPARRGSREVDGRAQELEDEPAAVPDSLRVGLYLHPGLDLARAGRGEHARALDLDDADAADIRRAQGLAVAERRRLDPELVARVEDRRPFEDRTTRPSTSSSTMRRGQRPCPRSSAASVLKTPRRRSPTRSRSTPSDRGRRSTHRACTGRSRRQSQLARHRPRVLPLTSRARLPPGERCRPGRGRTARTTRHGRRQRSA